MKLLRDLKHDKEFDTRTLFTDIGSIAEDTRETADRKTLVESEIKASPDQKTQEYQPRPLTPDDEIYEDIIEQFATAPTKPKYWFEELGDYWSCSCGHINKGDVCKSCGLERELLRSLFILHRPVDTPGKLDRKLKRVKGLADKEDEQLTKKENRRKQRDASGADLTVVTPIEEDTSRRTDEKETHKSASKPDQKAGAAAFNKKMIAVISACIVLIAGIGIGIYAYTDPGDSGEVPQTLQTDIPAFDELGTQGSQLTTVDKTALTDATNTGKFAYVEKNLPEGSAQAETYMAELMAVKYPGIQEIYDEYYAWHVTIVANTAEDDFSTDLETVSRKDTVYFHSALRGGEPDEKIELYYEVTWPDGSSQIYDLDNLWQDGSRISARFQYPIPLFGAEGKLTFHLYDKSTNELLGSDTVMFTN